MTKHYHVLGGLHGYMPMVNDVYTTLQAARQGLMDHKRLEIEYSYQMEDRSQFSVSGNLRQGYYEVAGGGNEYYEITDCQEPDCLLFDE